MTSSSSSELSYAEVLELELELELEDELELELEDELELELVHFAPGVDGERQSAALNNIRKKREPVFKSLANWLMCKADFPFGFGVVFGFGAIFDSHCSTLSENR